MQDEMLVCTRPIIHTRIIKYMGTSKCPLPVLFRQEGEKKQSDIDALRRMETLLPVISSNKYVLKSVALLPRSPSFQGPIFRLHSAGKSFGLHLHEPSGLGIKFPHELLDDIFVGHFQYFEGF
jgi:hypothetical protein